MKDLRSSLSLGIVSPTKGYYRCVSVFIWIFNAYAIVFLRLNVGTVGIDEYACLSYLCVFMRDCDCLFVYLREIHSNGQC